MGKGSGFDKNGLKKGAWTEDEDTKLRAYIMRYGHWNWSLLPQFAGVARSGKSCRLRWMNYLQPNIKHGNFTQEEDNAIMELHNSIGNKWSAIAATLPGRSDNEIKNRWNIHLKKRVHQTAAVSMNEHIIRTTHDHQTNPEVVLDPDHVKVISDLEHEQEDETSLPSASPSSTGLLSSWSNGYTSGSPVSSSTDFTPHTFDDEVVGNFWTEPFLPDDHDDYNVISSGDYNLWSSFNYVNDFIYQSDPCEDMLLSDEFLWSTFDSYVHKDNMDIN